MLARMLQEEENSQSRATMPGRQSMFFGPAGPFQVSCFWCQSMSLRWLAEVNQFYSCLCKLLFLCWTFYQLAALRTINTYYVGIPSWFWRGLLDLSGVLSRCRGSEGNTEAVTLWYGPSWVEFWRSAQVRSRSQFCFLPYAESSKWSSIKQCGREKGPISTYHGPRVGKCMSVSLLSGCGTIKWNLVTESL